MRILCRPSFPPTPQEDFERRNKIVQQFKMKVTRAKNMCIWWCMTKVCVAAFVACLFKDSCGCCLTHNLQCSPFAPRVTPFCVSPLQMLIRCWRAQWALHYRKESEKALLLKLVCVGA